VGVKTDEKNGTKGKQRVAATGSLEGSIPNLGRWGKVKDTH